MILMFNKQYREESKLISELVKKIKKSQSLTKEYRKNSETYILDTICIEFELTSKTRLTVKDKSDNVIVEMDCTWAQDALQEARSNLFSQLLEIVRNTHDKRLNKSEQFEQYKKEMETKQKELDKATADKAAAEAAIFNARQRLKRL